MAMRYPKIKFDKMGHYLCLTIFCLLGILGAKGQNIEITPSYGYHFGSKLDYGSNYIEIEDSDQFGLTIGLEIYTNSFAEISYIHQSTSMSIRDRLISPAESPLSDLSIDWIQVGGARYFPSGNIRPFAGGGLGLAIFSPKNENRTITGGSLDSTIKFAFSAKGGIAIMFSDRIGLNLQGNLYIPVEWGGLYVGGGPGGISGGVGVGSTTIIGGFSGGLIIALDKSR